MALCWSCTDGEVITDPDSGTRVCTSCGLEHSGADYVSETFDASGRPIGTVLFSGEFGYRERKLRDAKAIISDLTRLLGLSPSLAAEVTTLVSRVTDGDFGAGDWFPVLVGACSHLVMRQHRSPLPFSQIASALNRDVHEIGRMAHRVIRHLNLEPLPEFDVVESLQRAVRSLPNLPDDKLEEITGQGRFILHCAMKWSLLTGRQPLAVIAAVIAFVTDVNGVGIPVEEIAKHIHATATVSTSKVRLRELQDILIKVARALLPWGADVTVKNLVHNGPLLIRLMELKSRNALKFDESLGFEIDVDALVDAYADDEEEDVKYLKLRGRGGVLDTSAGELEGVKLEGEPLKLAYKNVLQRLAQIKGRGELGKVTKRRKRGGFDLELYKCSWEWSGRWEADKGLTLEEVWRKDVGYDALPPSFVAGIEATKRRRLKIQAARSRINEIMKRPQSASMPFKDSGLKTQVGKKRQRKVVEDDNVDWEDCIVELLMLHGVAEDEIEQGQYKRLMELHIFS